MRPRRAATEPVQTSCTLVHHGPGRKGGMSSLHTGFGVISKVSKNRLNRRTSQVRPTIYRCIRHRENNLLCSSDAKGREQKLRSSKATDLKAAGITLGKCAAFWLHVTLEPPRRTGQRKGALITQVSRLLCGAQSKKQCSLV